MPKYASIGTDTYQWWVTRNDGTVLTGTVEKNRGWGSKWSAMVTFDDGEAVVTPQGGRITGHGDTRKVATERAIHNHVIGEDGRWLAIMNT